MNQIRKDSFCKKIGGDILVFSVNNKSGLRPELDVQSQISKGVAVMLNESVYAPQFETKAAFDKSKGNKHILRQQFCAFSGLQQALHNAEVPAFCPQPSEAIDSETNNNPLNNKAKQTNIILAVASCLVQKINFIMSIV